MITDYIMFAVVLGIYAAFFIAIERRLEKSQKAITSMINEFTINISEQLGEIRKQTERLNGKR